MVAYKATAERAFARFQKGDNFIAEGYVHTYPLTRDSETIEAEEFVAKKLGHDLARTTYEVDRSHRTARTATREVPNVETPALAEERESVAAGIGM